MKTEIINGRIGVRVLDFPYWGCTRYGPYLGKQENSREFYVLIFPNKQRKSITVSRYMWETQHKQHLPTHISIDHINRNKNDNRIGNLQPLLLPKHAHLDAQFLKPYDTFCGYCGAPVQLKGIQLHNFIANSKRASSTRTGPFCGRSCASKFGRLIQLKRVTPILNKINAEYERIDIKNKNVAG